jgi:hypothetical protein
MMNRKLILNTLAIISLSGLALGSVAARADTDYDGRRGYTHNADVRHDHDAESVDLRHRHDEGSGFLRTIDARQDRQKARIQHGVDTDRLNRREYTRLMDEQQRIGMVRQRFTGDRRLDSAEFERLNHMLDRADQHIKMANFNRRNEHRGDRS